MKMVCNLQRRIWNCGGIVVELFGRNQLWWFWRWWWLILGPTGRWMKVGEVKGPGSGCEVPGSGR
jgi:hypothetical protein